MVTKLVVSKKEILFWTSYFVYIVFSILQTTFYQKYLLGYYNSIYVSCAIMLLTQELLKGGLTKKSLKGMIIFAALVFLSMYINERQIMILLLLVFVGRDVDFKRIAKCTVWVTCILVVITIASADLGIINNYVSVSTGQNRDFLGFRYVLYAPAFITNVILLEIYTKKERIKYSEILWWLAVSVWFYQKTHARLAFYLSVLMLVVALIMKHNPYVLDKRKFVRGLMATSFLWVGIIALVLIATYSGTGRMQELNEVLSNRLLYGQRSLLMYGVKILPQEIDWVGFGLDYTGQHSIVNENMLYVDCLYLKILQRFGVIFFVIIFGLLVVTAIHANKDRNYYLLLALFFIAIHFAIDDLYLYIQYNTFWFVIGSGLFGRMRGIIDRVQNSIN